MSPLRVVAFGLLVLAVPPACTSAPAGLAPDSGFDTSPRDTGDSECPEYQSSASWDECCWQDRPVSPASRLVADLELTAPAGDLDGLTVIPSQEDLDAWWAATGAPATGSLDFATEVAVGYLSETAAGCDEHGLDGLRAGDTSGTWFAGIYSWSNCALLYDQCAGRYVAHATLYAAPIGTVRACSYGAYCDG